MSHKHLILGGARSGKSDFAEQSADKHATASEQPLFYIATATAGDSEMQARIEQHQQRRDARWSLVEEPIRLAKVVSQTPTKATILIDCFTLWLSNCLHEDCWAEQRKRFLAQLSQEQQRNIIMVSNEVGSGIVPMGELSRQFVDEIGWLNQEIAELCDEVSLVCAGLSVSLKA